MVNLEGKEILKDFFIELSERMDKENHLSDILYASLKASCALRKIFEDFGLPISDDLELVREFSIKLGRPDFMIKNKGGDSFLLEIKLLDTNYHYGQYSAYLDPEGKRPQIFLLTAHTPVINLPGWQIISWHELIKKMDLVHDIFIAALAKYFKEVTMYEELKPINLSSPIGLSYLNRAVKHTIKSYQSQRAVCDIYKLGKNFTEEYSGYYYYLKSKANQTREVWLYFGLLYEDYEGEIREGIHVWIDKRWTKENLYLQIVNLLNNHYKKRLQEDESGHYVMLERNKFEKFFSINDTNQQISILKDFFKEFNELVEKCL